MPNEESKIAGDGSLTGLVIPVIFLHLDVIEMTKHYDQFVTQMHKPMASSKLQKEATYFLVNISVGIQ